jgi:hypothetical protein
VPAVACQAFQAACKQTHPWVDLKHHRDLTPILAEVAALLACIRADDIPRHAHVCTDCAGLCDAGIAGVGAVRWRVHCQCAGTVGEGHAHTTAQELAVVEQP